jgi:glyoxylate reductase
MEGVTYVELSTLLHQSDIVSLHVALTDDTFHLIGSVELAAMKPSAILINTARGAVVDQVALAQALNDGTIAAAGLDVFEKEPLPLDDPIVRAHNCVALPHIGSATRTTRAAMLSLAVDNVIAGLAGERLPCCINPEVYGS